MNIFHYLISSMCAHPSDQTVQIHTNGISDKVRFSFNMFRFTESFSYIYLHCEGNHSNCLKQYNNSFSVRICNTTSEICEGEGQICTGIDRGKRSLDYSNDFYNSSDSINGAILPFMSDSERDRRSPGDYIPLHEDTQQFISRGPILAYIKDDTGQGEFTVNSIFLDIGTIFISIFTNMNIFMLMKICLLKWYQRKLIRLEFRNCSYLAPLHLD